jgi:ADA HAT complex component 1
MRDMFRFWSGDAKADDRLAEAEQIMTMCSKDLPSLATSPRPLKREASPADDGRDDDGCAKRAKVDYSVATPPETPAMPRQEYFASQSPQAAAPNTDRVVDIINQQFGTEILLKHEELRFINQELAKCQIALEQLRRCHLIPYPTSCPTPQQMLDISQGKGSAVPSRAGEPAAQWAPPFGVTDGPYARHYAKWLIPDPKFGDVVPEWQGLSVSPRNTAEGRTTRNSLSEATTIGKRVPRGQTGQKLTSTYSAPKPKAPCIVKRSNGVVVKLVCNSCHRDNFSSTQGFINHCRIAHRKEYKSHEEAAIDCGHPISVSESSAATDNTNTNTTTTAAASEGKPPSAPAPGIAHPLARTDATAEQNAYAALLKRINESLKSYHQGTNPNIPVVKSSSPSVKAQGKPLKSFAAAPGTPFLSDLLQKRDFQGDLSKHVEDAKSKVDLDDYLLGDEESDDGERYTSSNADRPAVNKASTAGARVPASGVRIPARAVPAPAVGPRPPSSKGRSPHLAFTSTASKLLQSAPVHDGDDSGFDDANMMDVDHSPNTATSNNAPSLVSDDGGDDESDDGSLDSSDDSPLTEVTEVNIEYPEVQDLSQHGSNTGARGKDENRHVTFVTPLTGKAAARRKP